MKIPFVDIKRNQEPLKKEIFAAIEKIVDTTQYILGPAVEQFEQAFATYCGKKNCVGVSNGTSALELALRAYNIQAGDEVITTPNTFFSGASVINLIGATPVFVDVEENSNNMDPEQAAKVITKKTKAIIVTHLYGRPANMEAFLALGKKHNITIIEDCAQAHGATYKGKKLPYGETGCFSFYPGKNLGSWGDGGAVVTDNQAIAERIKSLRNFGGSFRAYQHNEIAGNNRLQPVQAAVLNVKLKHLDTWVQERRRKAAYYDQHLKNIITIPTPTTNGEHAYYVYCIETEQRDALQTYLETQ
ncbi:MAG: DegT/DnrJ/EryC1/StrS family aminotransferase, partial [Nanoarchaeota archaeon]|nr:DegT/DnrJ/EryC1/StrS family aminotransferase [Nanoarchaeota archaeon]